MSTRRKRLTYVAVAVAQIASVTACVSAPPARQATSQPNIVLLLTDDQRWDGLRFMPHVRQDLVSSGVTFSNAYVENSLCCPSRAAILTGNMSHTTGVYTNQPPFGGYEVFHDRGEENSTIATWLHDEGYHTGLVGKYLNGYADTPVVPPGWDRWAAYDQLGLTYTDYTLNVDGTLVNYGETPADYSTDVLSDYATDFIRSAPSSQPLFLYFAVFAPHFPSTPAPRDVGSVLAGPSSWPPSVNEADVSDKPPYVRELPKLSLKVLSARYVRYVESLAAVDDAVQSVVAALRDTGRLDNTLIVFMSDNGVLFGEHRRSMKEVPYEEAIRVPMVLRYDPLIADPGSTDNHLVMNIDIAPTFAAAAGVTPPNTDGSNILGMLDGTTTWRSRFLIEHGADTGPKTPPTYCALHTARRIFVRYNHGFEEFYDLRSDPYQLTNLSGDPRQQDRIDQFREVLRTMCQPLPPDMRPF